MKKPKQPESGTDRIVEILKEMEAAKLRSEIQWMRGDGVVSDITAMSSGITSLDIALGIGGYPHGRIVEIYGPESSGKSTTTLHAVASAQKGGGVAAVIDSEFSLDTAYAAKLGVDVENLLINQPDSGEQGLEMVQAFSKVLTKGDIIVVDSVAALSPQAEIDGELSDAHVGLQARMMSQALRMLKGTIAKSGVIVFFTNQLRCLPLSTVVYNQDGFSYLSDVCAGDVIFDHSGQYVKVVNVCRSGVVEGKEIWAKECAPFKLSNMHLQPLIRKGEFINVLGKDVCVGDWMIQPICSCAGQEETPYIDLGDLVQKLGGSFAKKANVINLPSVLDEDLAFFLGCCYSDGNLFCDEAKSDYRIQFTENNKERYSLIYAIFVKLFGNLVRHDKTRIYICSKTIFDFLKSLGMKSYGPEKTFPDVVLKSRLSVVKSFILGAFFDTHGFNEQGFISTHENAEAAQQFSKVLYRFGVFADVRKNYLHITGEDAVIFKDVIGFAEETKKLKAKNFSCSFGARGKYDVVPFEYCEKLFAKIKERKIKGISSLPYYGAFKQCLLQNLNSSRKGLIDFVCALKSSDFLSEIEFLKNNRFFQIQEVRCSNFEAVDIETVSGSFVADRFLTHNSKIGISYGNPEVTSGGRALSFYASIRLDIRKKAQIKNGEDVLGNLTEIKVVKNKCAPPYKVAETEIRYGEGVPRSLDVLLLGMSSGVVEKSGAWLTFGGNSLGQGKDKSWQYLKDNLEVLDKLEQAVREKFGLIGR
jgi:RecA/RadA recombinase